MARTDESLDPRERAIVVRHCEDSIARIVAARATKGFLVLPEGYTDVRQTGDILGIQKQLPPDPWHKDRPDASVLTVPAPNAEERAQFTSPGGMIPAIKALRERTRCGLVEAKDALERATGRRIGEPWPPYTLPDASSERDTLPDALSHPKCVVPKRTKK